MTVSPITKQPFLKMFVRRLIVGAALTAFFAWLALRPQPGEDDRLVNREFLAMGTVVSVSLYLDPGQDRQAAETALHSLETDLRDYERRWSAWSDGPLGSLNRQLADGARIEIPADMQPLFSRAARYAQASDGRFDVRLGRLVALWGFNDETQFRSTPPAPDDIAALVTALRDAPQLPIEARQYGPATQVWLDFGAIAKGDATDLAIDTLREAGYPNAIVNAGGNLRASGQRGERAWRIGVRHPRPDAQYRLLATLDIDGDEAVITSGDYERYFDDQGQRYHHLLDPRTGLPASGLQSVTVVADNGALADAASTALFVAGAEQWREVARALDVDRVFVVDASGHAYVTAALAQRVRFTEGIQAETVP